MTDDRHSDDRPAGAPRSEGAEEDPSTTEEDPSTTEEDPSTTEDEAPAERKRDLPSTALTEIPTGHGAPRPPRRTGVFLDPEDLREYVSGLLRASLGGHEVDAFGNITFTHEDARVFVTVTGSPVGPQVGVFSVTNLDVPFTIELAHFLLTTNHTLGFGAFSYDPEHHAVWLRHTLLGNTLDLPELQTSVIAVATTAARLDHDIRDRFGGRTFQEAPSDVQRRVEPPDPDDGSPRPNARGYL